MKTWSFSFLFVLVSLVTLSGREIDISQGNNGKIRVAPAPVESFYNTNVGHGELTYTVETNAKVVWGCVRTDSSVTGATTYIKYPWSIDDWRSGDIFALPLNTICHIRFTSDFYKTVEFNALVVEDENTAPMNADLLEFVFDLTPKIQEVNLVVKPDETVHEWLRQQPVNLSFYRQRGFVAGERINTADWNIESQYDSRRLRISPQRFYVGEEDPVVYYGMRWLGRITPPQQYDGVSVGGGIVNHQPIGLVSVNVIGQNYNLKILQLISGKQGEHNEFHLLKYELWDSDAELSIEGLRWSTNTQGFRIPEFLPFELGFKRSDGLRIRTALSFGCASASFKHLPENVTEETTGNYFNYRLTVGYKPVNGKGFWWEIGHQKQAIWDSLTVVGNQSGNLKIDCNSLYVGAGYDGKILKIKSGFSIPTIRDFHYDSPVKNLGAGLPTGFADAEVRMALSNHFSLCPSIMFRQWMGEDRKVENTVIFTLGVEAF